MNTCKSLLVTPFPMANESLAGLILRTTERNGYASPNQMLRIGRMTENEIRSVWPPFEKLAKLYARSPEDFAGLGYTPEIEISRGKSWRLLNHVVPALYMGVKCSKICPECILEHGYVEAYWDLRHAIACPVHKRKAVTHCPSCKTTIKWQRPGLLECKCGQDLTDLRGEPFEDKSILDTLSLIKAKLNGDIASRQCLVDRGFPISDIESISLSTLLGIVGRFGLRHKRNRYGGLPEGYTDEMYALSDACKVLERWPHGLYDYLENLPSERKIAGSFNLQRQFHSFYTSMFKSGLPSNETAFLKKAFVSFGNERWKKKAFIDIRLANSANESRNVVGIAGLAKYLRVMPPTVMSYVKKGLIQGQTLTSGKRTRRIFDLSKDVPFKPAEGRYYKSREAALFLGISHNLLRTLRQTGLYKVVRLGWGIDGYSELDLIEFRDRLLKAVGQDCTFNATAHITLGQIFRKKRLTMGLSVRLISELLDGTLNPCGQIGSQIKDIFLLKTDLEMSIAMLGDGVTRDRVIDIVAL